MNLDFSPQDVAFRQEVREFIAAEYPADLRAKQESGAELGKEDFLSWHRTLARKGWVAPAWPKEYGGPGWSPIQRFIFSEELAAAGTVPILPFGIAMVAPVIQAFGTPEQKAAFPSRHPVRRRLVVPGLFRAGLRLRPRLALDTRQARR